MQTNAATFKVTTEIYMDFAINNEPIGRLVFGLFEEDAPKTVKNFREICLNGINGRTYAGSLIHRVIDKFIIQGKSEKLLQFTSIFFVKI